MAQYRLLYFFLYSLLLCLNMECLTVFNSDSTLVVFFFVSLENPNIRMYARRANVV